MKERTRNHIILLSVVICRLVAGITFVLSGWSKAIDPYGSLYKISEYLSAWHFDVPREVILIGAVGLAAMEFVVGIMVLVGCLRRAAVVMAAALMAFLLPLSCYIAIAAPVADCGCFGDMWVISNEATLLKNIVVAAAIVWLLMRNRRLPSIYHPGIQWLAIILMVAYPLALSFFGYNFQPLVDFRPFKVGTALNAAAASSSSPDYIYEKDGERRTFSLDNLPDSTWTFVEPAAAADSDATADDAYLAIYDGDADVTDYVLGDTEGDMLLLLINEPDIEYLTRSRFVNELASYAEARDCRFVGIIGANDSRCDDWLSIVRPAFEVYEADDTSLKQVARGDAALMMLSQGVIKWKYNLGWFDIDISDGSPANTLDAITPIDDGTANSRLLLLYLAGMIIIALLGLSPRIISLIGRGNSPKNC
ncbi:MAG: BT_3928 family protein [Muribaculaceae bacterium]